MVTVGRIQYFQEMDTEELAPTLEYSQHLYGCSACGQRWYIELLPEEQPSPGFAMKLPDHGHGPSSEEICVAKESLCIIAHGGFQPSPCRMAGCSNHQLKGRALCQLHLAFL
jgi:hypothetical protein